MIQLKGKYTTANVMVPTDLDSGTREQIRSIINHPAMTGCYVAVMPDCHPGSGNACIGLTIKGGVYVMPFLCGVDIGCGVLAVRLEKRVEDFEKFDECVRKVVPCGFKVHDDDKLTDNLMLSTKISFMELAKKIGMDVGRAMASIGSLGGGNHFLEIDEDPDGNHWLVVHSGSRNLGLQVANYHQARAKELMKKMFHGDTYKGMEFLPLDLGGEEYLTDMKVAQNYAYWNRRTMVQQILSAHFGTEDCVVETIESVHNYIDFEDTVTRKGAIRAHVGDRLVIPLNMRDGVIVGRGKGNFKWNCSAPHGAGRVLSRTRAKKELDIEEFELEMDGIWTSCVGKSTLDESPMAYKPISAIMDVIDETVDVDFVMKPVYNFKAT